MRSSSLQWYLFPLSSVLKLMAKMDSRVDHTSNISLCDFSLKTELGNWSSVIIRNFSIRRIEKELFLLKLFLSKKWESFELWLELIIFHSFVSCFHDVLDTFIPFHMIFLLPLQTYCEISRIDIVGIQYAPPPSYLQWKWLWMMIIEYFGLYQIIIILCP